MSYEDDMLAKATKRTSSERKKPKKKHSHGQNEGYSEKIRKKQEKIDKARAEKGLASKWTEE